MANEDSATFIAAATALLASAGAILTGMLTGRNTRIKDREDAAAEIRRDEQTALRELIANLRATIARQDERIASLEAETRDLRRRGDQWETAANWYRARADKIRHDAGNNAYILTRMLERAEIAVPVLRELPDVPDEAPRGK